MKPGYLLAAASLAANAVLLGVVVLRDPVAEPVAAVKKNEKRPDAAPRLAAGDSKLKDAIDAGDQAALAAAGVSHEAIRWIEIGRFYMKHQARMLALQEKFEAGNPPYWKSDGSFGGNSAAMRERRMAMMKANRDFQDELQTLTGTSMESILDPRGSYLSFLPEETRDKIRRIERDYSELSNEVLTESAGLMMRTDREKLTLVTEEKEREIAALLGPEGYRQYQLRTSQSAASVRIRYGSVIDSEQDFINLFALQKAFDDRFKFDDSGVPPTPAAMQERREAELQLQRKIEEVLGSERAQFARRSSEPEFRTLTALTARFNLDPETPDSIYAARDRYAAMSREVTANTTLTREEQVSRIRALGAQANAELERALGSSGAETYAGRSSWMRALMNGSAIPPDAGNQSPNSTIRLGGSVVPAVQLPGG